MRDKVNGYHWAHRYILEKVKPSTTVVKLSETPEQIADGFNFRRHLTCRSVADGVFTSPLPGNIFREKYLPFY